MVADERPALGQLKAVSTGKPIGTVRESTTMARREATTRAAHLPEERSDLCTWRDAVALRPDASPQTAKAVGGLGGRVASRLSLSSGQSS
jgi:hypothetical protein